MSRKSDASTYRSLRDAANKFKDKIYTDSAKPVKKIGEVWSLRNSRIPHLQLPNVDTCPSDHVEYREAKKSLEVTDERLAKKRLNLGKKIAFLDSGWAALSQCEASFGEEFKKFNQFMRGNMEKRERAQKKFIYDKHSNLKRSVDVASLKIRCQYLNSAWIKMRNEISKNKIYKRFLESIVDAPGSEFKDASDILPRIEELLGAKEEIQKRQEKELECLEGSVGFTMKFVGSKMIDVLHITGNLPIMKVRYDERQNRRMELENLLVDLKAYLTALLSDMLMNTNAIDVIYNQIRIRRQFFHDTRNPDKLYKMMIVGRTLHEFKLIRKFLQAKPKKRRSTLATKRKDTYLFHSK